MGYSAGQIAAFKKHAEGFMTSFCFVQRSSGESNGQGGYSTAWANVSTDAIKCRVRHRSTTAGEGLTGADVVLSDATFQILLPLGTDCTVVDRVAVVDGPTYQLIGSDSGRSDAYQLVFDASLIE